MNAPYFLEVLSHSGEVKSRHRLDALPITIGRAYDNDCILDDKHIAAHHAIIERDTNGSLILRDLGSFNHISHLDTRKKTLAINGDTVFKLGRSHLRLRDVNYTVASEIKDTHRHREGWLPALAGLLILTLIALTEHWLDADNKFEFLDYFSSVSAWLILSTLFCGLLAFASRIFDGTTHFGRHLLTFAANILLIQCIMQITSVMAFSLSWEFLVLYQSHLLIFLLAGLCWLHIRIINPDISKKILGFVFLLAATFSVWVLLNNNKTDDRFSDDFYVSSVYPPGFRLSKNESVNEFMRDVKELKLEIDFDRQKALMEDRKKTKN